MLPSGAWDTIPALKSPGTVSERWRAPSCIKSLSISPEVIEHQFAHRVPDALGTAYNRTKFIKERRHMMQMWADYLDKLKAGAEVIPLHGELATVCRASRDGAGSEDVPW